MAVQEERVPRGPESVAEFIGELRALKMVEGLSLRELQRRTGLPRSTIAHALRTDRPALPPWDRVAGLLGALGVTEEELPGWKATWTRLRLAPVGGHREPGAGQRGGPDGTARGDGPGAPDGPGGPDGGGAGGTTGATGPEAADDAPGPGAADGPDVPGGAGTPGGVPAGAAGAVAGAGDSRAVPEARWLPVRQRLAAHVATLVLGACLGAGAVLALGGGSPAGAKGGSPVEDRPCRPAGADPHLSPWAPAAGAARPAKEPPSWAGRVASGQEVLAGTDVVLPVLNPVTEGDALVVDITLTRSCPGPVAVTDTQGDTFRVVADQTDAARHRTLVLAAFGAHPLGTADSLHATFPQASGYQIAVDEFRGISAAVGTARAHGGSGEVSFGTGSARLDCAAGDLMVGAAGTDTRSAPVLTAEWTPLPVLQLSSYRLTTAYRVVPAARSCAAATAATAPWAATAVVFR